MYGLNFAPPSAISANNAGTRRRPLCRFGGVHSTDTSAKYADEIADETAEDIAGGVVVVEAEWLGLDHVSNHSFIITQHDVIMIWWRRPSPAGAMRRAAAEAHRRDASERE